MPSGSKWWLTFGPANDLLPTLGEYKRMLNLIAVSSFRRGVRSQSSSLTCFSTKIRMDTFGDLTVNCFPFSPLWGRVQWWDCIFSPSSTAPADSLWELSCFLSIKADPLIAPITARQALKVQSVSYETWYYTSNSDKYVLQSLLHCFQRKYKNYPFLSDASKPSS